MSGIAGFVDLRKKTGDHIEIYSDMINTLVQRGSNYAGIFISDNICLMNTRLAAADSENGKQPLILTRGDTDKTVLIYDGEIYNIKELKAELSQKGYEFRQTADTEVLLSAYMEWGGECLDKLNGLYAFAIWDSRLNRLFMARDRMGGRPFFYSLIGSSFIFASEIKTLLRHPLVRPEINTTSIAEIMLIGPGRTPGYGVFKNISEIKAGCCGYFSEDGLNLYPYWELKAKEHRDSFAETLENVNFLVNDSIKRQLDSDVPICSFLSGGLDSSIISAISGVKNTFSVDYAENDINFKSSKFQPEGDNKYIEIMTKFLNTNHTKITLDTEELVEGLFEAVKARDLPGMADVDSSMLLFCKAVKKHAGVALSGECADELFGGYPWYRNEKTRMIDGFPWSQSTAYRASFVKNEFLQSIDSAKYVYDKYSDAINGVSILENEQPLEKRMKEMFKLNTDWFMQTLIDRTDRMSMYGGLAVRIPYCDHRIVEYMYNVPWEYKNYMDREKGILRTAMEGVLPEDVLWRKKSPFPKTHNPKYLKRVSEILSDIISDPNSPLLQILQKSELETLLKSDNSVPWYGQLMTTPQTIAYFIQINFWLEHYKIQIVN